MTWTRWKVTIDAQHPQGTYEYLSLHLASIGRFEVVAMGCTETQVRAVVEYTAKGANSDDIKRRFTTLGIPRSNVEAVKVASVETDWRLNADLMAAIDSTTADVVAQVAADVSNAAQEVPHDEPIQVSWSVSMIDNYNEPITTGQALVNAHEYFAVSVA